MLFDVIGNRNEFLELSDEEIQRTLSGMFPERKLYSHSLDWRNSEKYILKARGGRGDVLVGWGSVTKEDDESELVGPLRCITLKSILDHRQEKRGCNSGSSRNRK